MDAFYGFTLAGSLGWFLGFGCGSLRKLRTYRRAEQHAESVRNLHRAIERRPGPSFALRVYRDARSKRIYGDRRVGLGAVPRDNDGASPGGLSAGRVAHIADAAALT